ncbi:MAG: RNA-binding protein [Gammaproteobacteria bacterium]|nr:RNA-binding protein [Gammaproteobacteria bacterium]
MQQAKKIQLRRQAHQLHPVVLLGQNGLTPEVHLAIDEALNAHELIKIRVNAEDKEARKAITNDILNHHQADLIQSIGHIIVIYREAVED